MKRLYAAVLSVTCVIAVPAFAKGHATAQNHQCMKDGQVVKMTKKECVKAGGKWEKMAAAPKPTTTPDTKPSGTPETKTPEASPTGKGGGTQTK